MTRISIVMAADDFAQVERYVRDLAADDVAPDAELVLVGPEEPRIVVPEELAERLGGLQVLSAPDYRVIYRSRLAGTRAARSPVVLTAETHAWPAPGTVAKLAAAIEAGADAAGPLMANANPGTRRSWAGFVLDYGRWWEAAVLPDPQHPSIPGHSSAWRRDVVLARGEGDPDVLRVPFILAEEMRDDGHEIVLVPDTRTDHLNADRPGSFVLERLSSGRFYGASRSRAWSPARRAVYAAGSVLIPPLRLVRVGRQLRQTPAGRWAWRHAFVPIAVAAVAGAVGEFLGYVTGRAYDDLEHDLELAKVDHALPTALLDPARP